MKICTKCSKTFESGKFCKFCGTPLVDQESASADGAQTAADEQTCASCGAVLKAGAKFCPKCGAKVAVTSDDEDTEDAEIRALLEQERQTHNAEIQYRIAEWYDDDLEDEKALEWYVTAAEQGHLLAKEKLEENVGHCDLEALQHVEELTHNKDIQYEIATRYASEYEKEEAQKWFLLAANQGHAEAAYKVGEYYEEKEDDAKAFEWYTKASNEGSAYASERVASCYLYGSGVKQDLEKALKLYEKLYEANPNDIFVNEGIKIAKAEIAKKKAS